MIDTTGLNKVDVLCALYNASRPLGMGFMHYQSGSLDRNEAGKLLEQTKYFDYLCGRVMKVDLSKDEGFDERLYDSDNGLGAAQKAIDFDPFWRHDRCREDSQGWRRGSGCIRDEHDAPANAEAGRR